MIKVTYSDGRTLESFSDDSCLIEKIEKQVKDLSVEELYKYVRRKYIFDDFTVSVKSDSVILFGTISQEKIVLMFDEYVDVTFLYKGDNE